MKYLFLSAAWANWLAAFSLAFLLEPLWQLLSITPLPTAPVYMDFFSLMIFLFGCGYYWASRDFDRNRSIILLGGIGKLLFVLISIAEVLLGNVSWQILILFSIDLIYGCLFLALLHQVKQTHTTLSYKT